MSHADAIQGHTGKGTSTSDTSTKLRPISHYQYRPLEQDAIRVLVLTPGEPNDPLQGWLEIVQVDSSGYYEPISYVWSEPGPPGENYMISILDGDKESMLDLAGGGLFAALRRFRSANAQRRLWADQICINQGDDIEKGAQVQLMNKIYKNAGRVLVWLGLDTYNEARSAFDLIRQMYNKLHDQSEFDKFEHQVTEQLDTQSAEEWRPLHSLTDRSWFRRGWIVQEVGTEAPATLFWGDEEIDWTILHAICDKLTNYHHFRKKLEVRTSDIKYLFRRFIEPDKNSYHANRYDFLYELHRARGLKFTDDRDRIFAFLGHYALTPTFSHGSMTSSVKADYTKTVNQVYIDFAKSALRSGHGTSALITLAAVQHMDLILRRTGGDQHIAVSNHDNSVQPDSLPSWVPDWRTYQGFILSEPISPHQAHGSSRSKFEFGTVEPILLIHGLEIDRIESCSQLLKDQDFHGKRGSLDSKLTIEYLWQDICHLNDFNLTDKYINGQTAFFALMQTLSNGCVQIAGREGTPYHQIPDTRWLEQAAMYIVKTKGDSDGISPELYKMGQNARTKIGKEEWSRSANGASKNRKFARTEKGFYVLGPAVMEKDDVVCVLFGGKMPFCLRPVGDRYMLVGECHAHGLMKGEAMDMMVQGELTEKVFELI